MQTEVQKQIQALLDDNTRLLVEMGLALKNWDNAKYMEVLGKMSTNVQKIGELTVTVFKK